MTVRGSRASRRGSRFALACLLALPFLVGGLVFGGRKEILERWYLYRLDSPVLEIRKHAIEELGELRSNMAVPRLIDVAGTDDEVGPRAVAAVTRGREEAPPELLLCVQAKPVSFLRRAVAAIGADPAAPSRAARSVLLTMALHGPKEPGHEDVLWEAVRMLGMEAEYPVRELVEALRGSDEIAAERAVRILGSPRAEEAVPALLGLLGHEKLGVQSGSSLACIGPPAVSGLIAALSAGSERERRSAGWALERMGPPASAAVPALVRALRDPKLQVRTVAAEALGAIGAAAGEAVPALLAALEDPGFGTPDPGDPGDSLLGPPECDRLSVIWSLSEVAPGSTEVIEALIRVLEGENGCLAATAARALGELGPSAAAAAPRLAVHLEHLLRRDRNHAVFESDWFSPRSVIDALSRIGSSPPEVLAVLGKALVMDDDEASEAASRALARLGGRAEDLTPALIEALGSADAGTVAHAAEALRRKGPSVLPPLQEVLRSEEPRARAGAVHTIAMFGDDAAAAIPSLESLLADSSLEVRTAALRALDRLGRLTDEALPAVLRALDENDEVAQVTAVRACLELGSRAEAIIPVLLRILEQSRDPGRKEVPGALASLAPDDPGVRAAIIRAVGDADPWVRLDALDALGSLGARGDEVVDAFSRALNETGPPANDEYYYRVRESAAARLAALGRGDVVIAALQSGDRRVRQMATWALGNLRPGISGARQSLETLLLDETDAIVAREARNALRCLK